jgi:RNA polymerase sigma-70 factor (ECF subfamily)
VTEESDGQLVRLVLAGETEVYGRLVERYRDRLGRYAVRMLGNQADAEEALQDAFVRGYRYLARCTRPEGFGAWLFGILVNRCRTHASRRAKREEVLVSDDLAVVGAAPGRAEERQAWRDTIAWAMEQLPTDQREAFLLRHVEDRTYEEMEELTGARPATLRMRVFRAREELRRLLAEVIHE